MSGEGEDLLAPLPTSPAIRSNTAAMRFATSYDDNLAAESDDTSSVASPHIPGTRRLPKNPSKSINPNATITQHIRHRSSLFWLQTNSIANIAAFEESNWDAESFINKRKELQFALEKLPVFLKNKTNSTLFGRRSPAAAAQSDEEEPSFDLLAAKLAQEEMEYEQEIAEILRKRRLHRAFQAWLAHHAWKKRTAASNKKPKKKRNKFPRDEDRPISLVVLASHPPTPEPTPPTLPPAQVVEESTPSLPMQLVEDVTPPLPKEEEDDPLPADPPHPFLVPSSEAKYGPEFTFESPATTETMDTYTLGGEEQATINKRSSLPPPRLSALLTRVFHRASQPNKPVVAVPGPHPNLLTRAMSFLKQHHQT